MVLNPLIFSAPRDSFRKKKAGSRSKSNASSMFPQGSTETDAQMGLYDLIMSSSIWGWWFPDDLWSKMSWRVARSRCEDGGVDTQVLVFNQWLASSKLAVCYGSYGIAGPFIDDLWWFTKGSTFFGGFWNLNNPWPYAWSHYMLSLEWPYFDWAEGGQNGQAGLWMFPKSLGCPIIAVFFDGRSY